MLHTCAFSALLHASHVCLLCWLVSREPVTRPCWVHILELFFTLFHTLPLHNSHLNTGFLNAELQANWYGIKPTKWLIEFNLTIPIIHVKMGNVWAKIIIVLTCTFLYFQKRQLGFKLPSKLLNYTKTNKN